MIYSIVRSILGGSLPYILLILAAGIIAELILWKVGYGNTKGLTVSYVINQLFAGLGSTIYPYVIAARAMADMAVTDGRQDNIDAASRMLRSGGWIALLVGIIVAAAIGASIGKRVVRKHLAAVSPERKEQ